LWGSPEIRVGTVVKKKEDGVGRIWICVRMSLVFHAMRSKILTKETKEKKRKKKRRKYLCNSENRLQTLNITP